MAYDIQVLVQGTLYLIICVLNFIVAIPIGVTVAEFGNQCILYTDFTRIDATNIVSQFSDVEICNFCAYVPVPCIFYTLILGTYHIYMACRTKDPSVGSKIWIIPFTIVNCIIALFMLIISCMLSVGLKHSCDSFLKGYEEYKWITKCADVQFVTWKDSDIGKSAAQHFYKYPKISEVASWITFLMWVAQVCLCVLRFIRNHRMRPVTSGNN